jgi:protein SCO1
MIFVAQALRSIMIQAFFVAALYIGAAGAPSAAEPGRLQLPAPGTYKLDRIQRVPFGIVREGTGFPRLLSSYTTGKITLLTFFYSQCTDPQGCPLAWNAFESVRDKIKADPQLHGKVRLVFFSFDPVHDSSETLQFLANSYKADGKIAPWHFIASCCNLFLEYTLQSFGQEISAQTNALGEPRVVINHLLKVFLIDRRGWVREIYTSAFLNPDVLLGDIKTLLLEESKSTLGD